MRPRTPLCTLYSALCTLIALPSIASAQQRPPLDHDVYDGWRTVEDERLSRDGRWVVFSLVPQRGDAVLRAATVDGSTTHTVPRGRGARFAPNGRFVLFRIAPELAAVDSAKRADTKPDAEPNEAESFIDNDRATS